MADRAATAATATTVTVQPMASLVASIIANEPGAMEALRERIRAQWQQARPKMVAQMDAGGKLGQTITEVAELTRDMLARLAAVHSPAQAWELARESWALPAETRVPMLGMARVDAIE